MWEKLMQESGPFAQRVWDIFDALWPALLLLIMGWFVVKWLRSMMIKVMARRMDNAAAGFMGQIAYAVMLVILIIAVLSQLGIDTTSLIAALGAVGLAVGLALKNSLENLAAGFLLVALRPFRSGDYIEGGSTAGTVNRITLLHTFLITPDNKKIVVPNGNLVGGNIINYSAQPTRRLDLLIGVSYDDDIRQVRTILKSLLDADERVHRDPEPLIAVFEFADSAVNFTVRAWVDTANYWPLKWDLMERIKLAFDEQGVTIPYPQRDVHLYANEPSGQALATSPSAQSSDH